MIMRYYFDHFFDQWEPLFLEAGAQPVRYEAGEALVSVGETLQHLFYVRDGLYKCSIITESGEEHLQSFQGPGSLLPVKFRNFNFSIEPAFSFIAITPVDALRMTPELLKTLALQNPELCVRAMDFSILYSNMLTTRLLQSTTSSDSKVCNFLYIYLNQGMDTAGRIPLTQEDVAAVTGLSRIQVARVYQRLRKMGILRASRGSVTILDRKALRNLCSETIIEDQI